MNKTLIYDLPTRLFHWIFAALFVSAFAIAKLVDDESVIFSYHMILGLTMAVAVGFRIIWGLLGSKHARFINFNLNPISLFEYFHDLFTGKTKLYPGHNPASSWAALVMMFLALGLAFSGIQMTKGNGNELFEEVHEVFGNLFLFTVIGHVLGVIIHTVRHKEMIGLSMMTGAKTTAAAVDGIQSSHILVGIVFLGIIGGFSSTAYKNFDPNSRTLNLMGNSLHLAKEEDHEHSKQDGVEKSGESGSDAADEDSDHD